MKKIILLFGLFLSCYAFSQGENNNWYIGGQLGITFNTNPPSTLTGFPMSVANEGVASISDSNGNLLFYTDGATIWDREHEVMENGTDLKAVEHTVQQVLILPHPGNGDLYYVFTMSPIEESTDPPYIAYSIVDMSLGEEGEDDEPLGAVTNDKNIALKDENGVPFTFKTEAVTAVLHSDNQSYWVLIPNGTNLYSYKLDALGLEEVPVTSPLSFTFSGFGSIKASPLLSDEPYSHLISIAKRGFPNHKWMVYAFNNSTGMLTPNDYEEEISSSEGYYSTEFNSDGTLLYGARDGYGDTIIVFEISSGNTNVVYSEGFNEYSGTLQRAVNNNIYFSKPISSKIYHISNPDSFTNSSLNLDDNDPANIDLGNNFVNMGLPQLIPFPQVLLCNENLILYAPEVSYDMLYEVSNTITTHQNYMIGANRDITLSAGKMVEILPDSHIKNGSIFRAMIEGCEYVNVPNRKDIKPVRYITNLDDLNKEQATDLKIHPNPTKEIITIVNTTIIDKVTITDMNGRVVKQVVLGTKESQINISDLSQGVYILNATSNEKTFTQKIVKQ